MHRVFFGKFCDVWSNANETVYTVNHGPKKVHHKTFKGEQAWMDAQRMAWDLGDLTCNL